MLRDSTGFKKGLLAAFPPLFNQGAIYIFGGARPASPDMAPASPPIGIITNRGLPWAPNSLGAGLHYVPYDRFIVGDPTQNWLLTPNAYATTSAASWWRGVAPFDTGLATATECRVDGDVGLKSSPNGEEILLDSLTLTPGVAVPIGYFVLAIPPLS